MELERSEMDTLVHDLTNLALQRSTSRIETAKGRDQRVLVSPADWHVKRLTLELQFSQLDLDMMAVDEATTTNLVATKSSEKHQHSSISTRRTS